MYLMLHFSIFRYFLEVHSQIVWSQMQKELLFLLTVLGVVGWYLRHPMAVKLPTGIVEALTVMKARHTESTVDLTLLIWGNWIKIYNESSF